MNNEIIGGWFYVYRCSGCGRDRGILPPHVDGEFCMGAEPICPQCGEDLWECVPARNIYRQGWLIKRKIRREYKREKEILARDIRGGGFISGPYVIENVR